MNVLSLFSGIGGLDTAAEWAGMKTVAFCEIEPYAVSVLEKRWPNVPVYRDVRQLTAERLRQDGIAVDVVVGGFPCQPFSRAGKQQGKYDDRHLWPEMRRIISETRPLWVVGENVENAVRIVLDDIIDDLENISYATQSFVISAYCSGAWFDGKRIFIVASPNDRSATVRRDSQFQSNEKTDGCWRNNRHGAAFIDAGKRWPVESRPVGVADGVPDRIHRLKCLGNAVNPYQAYPIFAAIMEVENALQN